MGGDQDKWSFGRGCKFTSGENIYLGCHRIPNSSTGILNLFKVPFDLHDHMCAVSTHIRQCVGKLFGVFGADLGIWSMNASV